MDTAPSPSLPTQQPYPTDHSNPTVENHAHNENNPKPIDSKNKKRVFKNKAPILSSSPSSSVTASSSVNKSTRVAFKRRSSKLVFAPVRRRGCGGGLGNGDVETIALPLGMSFAAVVAQVLERKDVAGERMSVDHLSRICTTAVRESLANVFGDKFDFFARNFQKSFGSTLCTLRSINESSINKIARPLIYQNVEGSASNSTLNKRVGCTGAACIEDHDSEIELPEEVEENISVGCLNQELTLHGQTNQLALHGQTNQLAFATGPLPPATKMASIIEKSVVEQTRSNDLKTIEIGLAMKRLKQEEDMLALTSESNYLERSKIVMGMSKASFKADKFKTQLEDTRHAELHRKCIDCLVAGLFIMSASLSYGAYVYSYRRIKEATAACTGKHEESKSWWKPNAIAEINALLRKFMCQFQVVIQMGSGIVLILAVAYLLVQRSSALHKTMPITFILILLGAVCGFIGKLCVDTLGGSGSVWLLYWEALCLLQFFSNVWTSTLFHIICGPIATFQGNKPNKICPYWFRQSLFYAISILLLPVCCGLLPFASHGEWARHFLFGETGMDD